MRSTKVKYKIDLIIRYVGMKAILGNSLFHFSRQAWKRFKCRFPFVYEQSDINRLIAYKQAKTLVNQFEKGKRK